MNRIIFGEFMSLSWEAVIEQKEDTLIKSP